MKLSLSASIATSRNLQEKQLKEALSKCSPSRQVTSLVERLLSLESTPDNSSMLSVYSSLYPLRHSFEESADKAIDPYLTPLPSIKLCGVEEVKATILKMCWEFENSSPSESTKLKTKQPSTNKETIVECTQTTHQKFPQGSAPVDTQVTQSVEPSFSTQSTVASSSQSTSISAAPRSIAPSPPNPTAPVPFARECKDFYTLGLHNDSVLLWLKNHGISKPSHVQQNVLTHIFSGENVFLQAVPSTGRTTSFIIAALNAIDYSRSLCQGLFICPTLTVAHTTFQAMQDFTSNITLCTLHSQVNPHAALIIGTIDSIAEGLNSGKFSISAVKMVAFCRATRIIPPGLSASINTLLKHVPLTAQVLMFDRVPSFDTLDVLHRFGKDKATSITQSGEARPATPSASTAPSPNNQINAHSPTPSPSPSPTPDTPKQSSSSNPEGPAPTTPNPITTTTTPTSTTTPSPPPPASQVPSSAASSAPPRSTKSTPTKPPSPPANQPSSSSASSPAPAPTSASEPSPHNGGGDGGGAVAKSATTGTPAVPAHRLKLYYAVIQQEYDISQVFAHIVQHMSGKHRKVLLVPSTLKKQDSQRIAEHLKTHITKYPVSNLFGAKKEDPECKDFVKSKSAAAVVNNYDLISISSSTLVIVQGVSVLPSPAMLKNLPELEVIFLLLESHKSGLARWGETVKIPFTEILFGS
ncbi:hypothetical protein Pelo_12394 [Pelomyxa schiedti]|nr:hypothetical protein Pelo_12394 [Pelomyxa schiedti]